MIVEAFWLSKNSNLHNELKGAKVSSKIGSRTGANHQVGRKIIEMREYQNIPCQGIKPLKKRW